MPKQLLGSSKTTFNSPKNDLSYAKNGPTTGTNIGKLGLKCSNIALEVIYQPLEQKIQSKMASNLCIPRKLLTAVWV